MPLKVAILGRPTNVEKMENYYRLTMVEGGSPVLRLGLPASSEEIEISVFVSHYQAQQANVQSIPKGKALLVNGEIALDLDMAVCPGELGVIATNVRVVDAQSGPAPAKKTEPVAKKSAQPAQSEPAKPNKSVKLAKQADVAKHDKKQPLPQSQSVKPAKKNAKDQDKQIVEANKKQQKSTSQSKSSAEPPKPKLPDWLPELHKRENGVCQDCGQHLDLKVSHYRFLDPKKPAEMSNAKLLCSDCMVKKANPALTGEFTISNEVVETIKVKTGWTEVDAKRWAIEFPKKYALVLVGKKGVFRVYWTWVKEEPFRHVVIDNGVMVEVRESNLKRTSIHGHNDIAVV